MQKLFVGLNQIRGASSALLWRKHRNLRALWQVVGERHELVDEYGCERFHSVNRNSLCNLLHHRADVWKLVHHLPRLVGDARSDDDFARGINLNTHGLRTLIFVQNTALICHREFSYVFEFIAEELDAHSMLCRSREDVDDATAHSKLSALCDHVDALIGELD